MDLEPYLRAGIPPERPTMYIWFYKLALFGGSGVKIRLFVSAGISPLRPITFIVSYKPAQSGGTLQNGTRKWIWSEN